METLNHLVEKAVFSANLKPHQTFVHKDIKRAMEKPIILLIEDNPIIQLCHRKYLEQLNCQVLIASDGLQALELYKSQPHLILLDIGLPKMSGFDVCRAIRAQEKINHIPIIAVTAFGDAVSNECHAAGVDDFATKPITKEELMKLLCRWLPVYRDVITTIKN
jgi:CheY-like chemotaxis protein